MKKVARIFLSREEKRSVTQTNVWDSVIEEVQKTFGQPPLLEKDLNSDNTKKKWVLLQLCARQEWKCFWCGRMMTNKKTSDPLFRSLEHVEPKSTKGKDVNRLSNLRAACTECNQTRSVWSGFGALQALLEEKKRLIVQMEKDIQDLEYAVTLSGKWTKMLLRVRKWFTREVSV